MTAQAAAPLADSEDIDDAIEDAEAQEIQRDGERPNIYGPDGAHPAKGGHAS